MKIELKVPEGARMTYVIDSDVQHIYIVVGAYAHLILEHVPHREVSVQVSVVLEKESSLVMHGWYEHAITMQQEVVLQGESASAEIKFGIKHAGNAVAKINTVQRHEAARTTSSLLCKSLLADRAQTIHTGMIYIAQGALDSNAKLNSNHILKGEGAYAQVQPSLEVLTDEVQCAHGSAIGMFDAYMLFYMQSRGIDATSASQLLEEAFFAEVR